MFSPSSYYMEIYFQVTISSFLYVHYYMHIQSIFIIWILVTPFCETLLRKSACTYAFNIIYKYIIEFTISLRKQINHDTPVTYDKQVIGNIFNSHFILSISFG